MADDLRCYETDAENVGVAIVLAEAKPFRQVRPHDVSVEQRHGAASRDQVVGEDLGNRRLTRAAETRQPDATAAIAQRASDVSVVELMKYSGRRTTSA